jgi:hypothetical protein
MAAPSMPPEHVEILACQPGHYVFASWRNLTILYWLGQAVGPAVRRLQAITAEFVEAHPEGISNIHLVKDGAGLPDTQARVGFNAIMERHPNAFACISIVLLGAGFWASALQSVITGLLMVAPRTFMLRFAGNPAELRTWLPKEHTRRTGEAIDALELARAIDQVMRIGMVSVPPLASAAS